MIKYNKNVIHHVMEKSLQIFNKISGYSIK